MSDRNPVGRDGRRSFLKMMGTVPAAMLAAQGTCATGGQRPKNQRRCLRSRSANTAFHD